jgi:hypothetical protein
MYRCERAKLARLHYVGVFVRRAMLTTVNGRPQDHALLM